MVKRQGDFVIGSRLKFPEGQKFAFTKRFRNF